jgi:hypothetical protein
MVNYRYSLTEGRRFSMSANACNGSSINGLDGDTLCYYIFAMLHALKFFGLLVVNIAVAVIGTAILTTALGQTFHPHSLGAILWKEWSLSIGCAAVIGFGLTGVSDSVFVEVLVVTEDVEAGADVRTGRDGCGGFDTGAERRNLDSYSESRKWFVGIGLRGTDTWQRERGR